MNNNRTRALLQTEPQAMFVIGVTLEDTIRNLEAVLESQVLLQSLQTELGKVGRTLVSVGKDLDNTVIAMSGNGCLHVAHHTSCFESCILLPLKARSCIQCNSS